MDYETPSITTVGSISEVTQGASADNLGDGASFRGPVPPPVFSS